MDINLHRGGSLYNQTVVVETSKYLLLCIDLVPDFIVSAYTVFGNLHITQIPVNHP